MNDWRLLFAAAASVACIVAGLLIRGEPGLFLAGIGAAAFITVIAVWRWLVQPMQEVAEAADEIAAGDLAARAWTVPSGPASRLAASLNKMADEVQSQVTAASQERSRLAAAMNSSVDALAALDADTRVLFANPGFARMAGQPQMDVVGRPLVYVLPDQQVLDAVRNTRDRSERQVTLIERPGRQFFQVVTTPITGGGDWSVLVVCQDITDVKRTELVRRDFVANVSHELRTPLAAIKSVVETLEAGALQDEAVALDFLRQADREVDRLVLMVEELLELSRIESGEQALVRTNVDVKALLQEVVERMASQAERGGVELRIADDGEPGLVSLDATRIERALVNLVQNAIKFTAPGGCVTVSCKREAESLLISVKDTGIGIDARDLPRIFERFYKVDQSRASTGSGLGLALVKHAVEAHGGSVEVASRAGEGSTFTLRLPLHPS